MISSMLSFPYTLAVIADGSVCAKRHMKAMAHLGLQKTRTLESFSDRAPQRKPFTRPEHHPCS